MRRAKNPNVIFRDIKAPSSQGVDYLLKPLRAKVVEVRPDEHAVLLEPAQPWNVSRTFECQGVAVDVIHAEPDCLWVQDVHAVPVGSCVMQLQCRGTKDELEKAFAAAWTTRWDRHKDVTPDRWKVILEFSRRFLPKRTLTWPRITPGVLGQMIAARADSSASGLDGVSVRDLKSVPAEALANFCDLFTTAESTGGWPSQLLMGKVVCLAEVAEPRDVMDYRPITILGQLYRLWGSYHARKAIRMMEPVLPDTLYGSRMSRFAGQVWSQLLWAVEDAMARGIALSGLMADLQKAFNHLPRLVVFEAAAILGIPMTVLTAWAGALSVLGRRFQLGVNVTQPVYSVTGLPEGDGLSCLGMLVVDVLFHCWHAHFFPLCEPVSYVDDWTVLTTDPARMSEIFACLTRFTDALDLLLDGKKTFVWSTCHAGRQSLRSQGFSVETSCRMLGAHVQTTRKHTNATQMSRIQGLTSVWPKLKLSASPYELKLRAIRTAAWPKGLHAIAATTVSMQTFSILRAGAMKGLGADGAGCNSMVHLGLVERPTADPHFWAIIQTVRLVRECGIPETVHSALFELATGNSDFALNGITATLLTRLQLLGWHVGTFQTIEDDFGCFSLFSISFAELQWRIEWAWLKAVAAHVAHRPGFAELDRVDPVRTPQWIAKLPPDDRAAFRKLLNGAHVTQDGKHYCQESESDVCLYCSCSDSRFHRFWVCDHFASCRQDVAPEVMEMIVSLPECVTCYGWALRPTTFPAWFAMLAEVPDRCIPSLPWPDSTCVHVFTDGTCANPGYADLRYAAYSVVLADPSLQRPAEVLDCGPLPGVRQTSVRAELFAVMRAIRFAACRHVGVVIWSDCLVVVRRLRRILMGGGVRINSPNADLWMQIADDVQAGCHVQITKVMAHQSIADACSPLEEWCFIHNQCADHAAARANAMRDGAFWNLLMLHAQACQAVDRWNSAIQQVLLRVSRKVLMDDHAAVQVEVEPMVCEVAPRWCPPLVRPPSPVGAVRWYGTAIVDKLLDWYWQVVVDCGGPVVWVSNAQLYIDYALTTGDAGPIQINGWKDSADVPLHALLNVGFKDRARMFGRVLREVLKHAGVRSDSRYCRPSSHMICMYASCMGLPLAEERLCAVDKWLTRFTKAPFRRQSKELDHLPVPASSLAQ